MRMLALPLAVIAAGAFASAHAADDLPKRKAGLWEMKTALMEMGGMGPQMQICVGEQSDELFSQAAGNDDSNCAQKKYNRAGNRVTFDAVCKVQGTTATIHGVFSGDFTTAYTGEIRTTYNPPLQGMSTSTMKQEGRWLGPCKAGQKPGDVAIQGMPGMGGGAKFNVDEMMKNMPRGPAAR